MYHNEIWRVESQPDSEGQKFWIYLQFNNLESCVWKKNYTAGKVQRNNVAGIAAT